MLDPKLIHQKGAPKKGPRKYFGSWWFTARIKMEGALLTCKNIQPTEIPPKLRANYSDNRFNLTFK